MSNPKKYRLLKTYESPLGRVHAGVTETAQEWQRRWFPRLKYEDFDIKNDWFEEITDTPVKEKMWVRIVPNENYAIGKWCGYYILETPKAIPEATIPAIKKAIEEVLNPSKCEVCGIEIKTRAKYCGSHWRNWSPEPPKPAPLFTTEDGKGVFLYQTLWVVEIPSYNLSRIVKMDTIQYEGSKYFSTEEAAKEYVIMNKPCLSVKEVFEIADTTVSGDEFEENIKHVAQSKYSPQPKETFQLSQELPKDINVNWVDTAEQPKKERIEVEVKESPFTDMGFYVDTKRMIAPKEKFPVIKKAIEYVLNGDDKTYKDFLINGYDRMFTREQMDKAIAEAFGAARELHPIMHNSNFSEKIRMASQFSTLQDYLNHLSKQSKE